MILMRIFINAINLNFEFFLPDLLFLGICLYELITRLIPEQRMPKDGYAFNVQYFKQHSPTSTPPEFTQVKRYSSERSLV